MMKTRCRKMNLLFVAVMASMFVAPFAFAADMDQSGTSDPGMSSTQSQALQTASDITADELKGLKVVDQDGKDIGKITDVVADQSSGAINFVTLAKGGIMGVGASRYAVPIRALDISQDKKQATLNVDESLLTSAPEQTPDMSSKDFELQLEQHYGISPAWKSDQDTFSPDMQNQLAPQEEDQGRPSGAY